MGKLPQNDEEFALAVLNAGLAQLEIDVRDIRQRLRNDHVQRAEFEPVKSFVFVALGIALMAVVGVVLSVLMKV